MLSELPNLAMPTTVDLHRLRHQHGGGAADVEVTGVGRRAVDHDLAGRGRRAAVDHLPRVERRGGHPVRAARRRAVAADAVAVGADDLHAALRRAARSRRRRRPLRPATPTDAGIAPCSVSPSAVMRCSLRTSAAVPLFASVKRVPKLSRTVSPSTSVPARNATPTITAVNMPKSRRLRLQRSLNVSDPIVSPRRPSCARARGRSWVRA